MKTIRGFARRLFVPALLLLSACEEQPEVMIPSVSQEITSRITCPKCKFQKTEHMPTEACIISYTCTNCREVLHPKSGDCCVFCSYGDEPCPPIQNR